MSYSRRYHSGYGHTQRMAEASRTVRRSVYASTSDGNLSDDGWAALDAR